MLPEVFYALSHPSHHQPVPDDRLFACPRCYRRPGLRSAIGGIVSARNVIQRRARVLGGVNLDAPITVLGTEPFWNIGFGHGRVVFSSPGSHEGRTTSEPFFFSPEGAEWHGKGMDIYLTAAHCSDGMSDRRYPLTAIVHIGETKLKGCAGATTSFSGDRKIPTRPASNP